MAEVDTHMFSDDLPKENPWRDDRLGYKPFAERLAKVIATLKVPNGYVIGLHGEWGSGKSTALNFVRAFLEKHNQETELNADHIALVDFRPWIVSGHQDLIAAFFKVMSDTARCTSSIATTVPATASSIGTDHSTGPSRQWMAGAGCSPSSASIWRSRRPRHVHVHYRDRTC
jgi:energy-coupling factor transporter ATP-binding protein EcfA2